MTASRFGRITKYGGLALLSLGGCSLVPPYLRPALSVSDRWAEPSASAGLPLPVRARWWQRFGSRQLDQLEEQGLTGSFTVQAAIARIRQAEGTARIAAAPLYPAIAASGNASPTNRSSNYTSQGTTYSNQGSSSSSRAQAALEATYEIDFWGANRAAADSARALVRASVFDADTVAMTLSASIADEYFTVLSLRERIALAQRLAADARKVLTLLHVQQAAGTATDLQIRQQETALASFDAATPTLQTQLGAAMHNLAVLVGQTPETFSLPAAALASVTKPEIASDLPSALLALRPDIQAAEARLVSANFDVGVARAAFFPRLTLSAGVGLSAASGLSPASAAASLLAPIFEGGRLRGQLQLDRARREELIATYRQTILTALQDVEDALSAISGTAAQEQLGAGGAFSADQATSLALTQFRAGSADYLTVLTTEQAQFQAKDVLAQARLQHLQALVGLCRALGGGFGQADLRLLPDIRSAAAPPPNDGKIGK